MWTWTSSSTAKSLLWAAKAAFEYIIKGIDLAVAGIVDAVVTGPIHKEALNQAGHHYSGHTEIFAEKTGTKDYSMMLAHKDFRVAHVTTHVSLRQACDLVKKERVGIVIRLAQDANARSGDRKAPALALRDSIPIPGKAGCLAMKKSRKSSRPSRRLEQKEWMWKVQCPRHPLC